MVTGNLKQLVMLLGSIGLLSVSVVATEVAKTNQNIDRASVTQNLAGMPLPFTKNMGQWPDSILFRASANGATMWFTKNGIWYQFIRKVEKGQKMSGPSGSPTYNLNATSTPQTGLIYNPWAAPPSAGSAPFQDGQVGYLPRTAKGGPDNAPDSIETTMIKAEFVGASQSVEVVGLEEQEYKCNYFIGNDQSKWRTDVPNYNSVSMRGLYAGVDVTFSAKDGRLQEELIASTESDLAQVKVEYRVRGVPWAADVPSAPFQDGQVGYLPRTILADQSASRSEQQIPSAISSASAVTLVYSTYLGGGGGSGDDGVAIALDGAGSAYVTGNTTSGDFPTATPFDGNYDGFNADAFVTKLSPAGNTLVYSTYLGGSGSEYGSGIAVDGAGSAYMTGITLSADFPTVSPFDGTLGINDAFVTKLSPAGNTLVYSTYLGGGGDDDGRGIAVDGAGSAYVTGKTLSSDFPTVTSFDGNYGGFNADAFVTKLSPAGNTLVYSTYLGGSGDDYGRGIAVDGAGSAYVTGNTTSADFPTANPFDGSYDGVNADAFVTKLSPAGNTLVYSTYLGGSDYEYGTGIAVDGAGSAYMTGSTYSSDFPTANPFDSSFNNPNPIGDIDAFVTKLSPAGNTLVYSTYLGGSGSDNGSGIAVDGAGSAYVTGATTSADFPTATPFDGSYDGVSADAFVTKLSPAGNTLVYSSYLGGSSGDFGYGIAVDGVRSAYVTGSTYSADFPTATPFDGSYNGVSADAFVTKLAGDPPSDVEDNPEAALPISFLVSQNYPNPFNPSTTIEYSVPSRTHVTVEIFNMLGQNIRTLVNETILAGTYRIEWNGRDAAGKSVSTGVYLYRFTAGDYVETKKMVLVK